MLYIDSIGLRSLLFSATRKEHLEMGNEVRREVDPRLY